MADILHKLENNEAVLLMYLADELSVGERAEVEQMLRTDPSLRRMLDEMRELHEGVTRALGLPEVRANATANEMAVRRVVREMKRYQTELAARPAVVPAGRQRRHWPWWSYPIASAAAIIFVILGLWGVGVIDFNPNLNPKNPKQIALPNGIDPVDEDKEGDDKLVAMREILPWWDSTEENRPLDEAERHLAELRQEDEQQMTFPRL